MAGFQPAITINEAMQRIKMTSICCQPFKENMFGKDGKLRNFLTL